MYTANMAVKITGVNLTMNRVSVKSKLICVDLVGVKSKPKVLI